MSSFIPAQPQSALTAQSPFTADWLQRVATDLSADQQAKLQLQVLTMHPSPIKNWFLEIDDEMKNLMTLQSSFFNFIIVNNHYVPKAYHFKKKALNYPINLQFFS